MTDGTFERVFIALGIPEETSAALAELKQERPGFRWATENNLHLTLRFIGEVDLPLKEAIIEKLSQIEVEEFILPVEGIGVLPIRGQPQVIYAGVASAHPRLFQLQHRLEEALASLGLPLELKTFFPHITLARVSRASPMSVREYIKRHRDFVAPSFKVKNFSLYQTTFTHTGSVYTPKNNFPLYENQRRAEGKAS